MKVHRVIVGDRNDWLGSMISMERWILDTWPSLHGSAEQTLVQDIISGVDQFYIMPAMGENLIAYFTDPRKATLFKLTWS